MLDRLFYEDKGVLLQSTNTVALLSYLGVLFTLMLLFSHPFYLLGIFLAGIFVVVAAGAVEKWKFYLKLGLWMAVLIMVINPLVFHAGKTVIWKSPSLPILGGIRICLEAVCYGAVMGIRLLGVLTVFCLANTVVHPDRLLSLFSRFAYKSALVVSLATRMLPAAFRSLLTAREVLLTRGVDFASGGLKDRVKKYSWLLDILLFSSLEGALQIAEAMQARAFGIGPRSAYRREFWQPRDFLCFGASVLALILSLYAKAEGYGDYTFYPQLGILVPHPFTLIVLGLILGSLVLPGVISWGCKYWPYLRSKI